MNRDDVLDEVARELDRYGVWMAAAEVVRRMKNEPSRFGDPGQSLRDAIAADHIPRHKKGQKLRPGTCLTCNALAAFDAATGGAQ